MADGIKRPISVYVNGNGDVIEFFNQEEIYENCTVQVLTNTYTGRTSVGWWQNNKEDDDGVD